MPNILVTGGKGFIGRQLVKMLSGKTLGHKVTVLDKDGYSGQRHAEWDGIVHLAALARVSDAERYPAMCMDSNLTLTAEMLNLKTKWFILASTCSPPTTIYGMSKQWAEQLSQYEAKRHGFGLRILRFTSVHGEGENPKKLLPMAISAVRNGTPMILSADALPLEYVSVYRVVNEILGAMQSLQEFPEIVVPPRKLCDGTIRTQQELMDFAKNVVHPDAQPA